MHLYLQSIHRFLSEEESTGALSLSTSHWICDDKQATEQAGQGFPGELQNRDRTCQQRQAKQFSILAAHPRQHTGRPDSLHRVEHYLIPQKEGHFSNSASVLQATGRKSWLKMVSHKQISCLLLECILQVGTPDSLDRDIWMCAKVPGSSEVTYIRMNQLKILEILLSLNVNIHLFFFFGDSFM